VNNDRFKFRVWSKEYGYETQHSLDIEDVKESNDNNGIPLRNKRESFVFEQCTGLKDKNGKLIFEGDIVSDCREKDHKHCCWFEMFFHDNDAACDRIGYHLRMIAHDAICGSRLFPQVLPEGMKKCEIIGNIHENPELLEGNNA